VSHYERLAAEVRSAVGVSRGKRILHVTDFHNGIAGFRFAAALRRVLSPDVVVNTGDVSGLGPVVERLWLRCLLAETPLVFAGGNHDSDWLVQRMERKAACALSGPEVCEAAGLRFWGYRDPNKTRFMGRSKYSPELCCSTAKEFWPPRDGGPVIAAVHNELMSGEGVASAPLVLSGHFHSPKVFRSGPTLFVRSGSIGGGGPFGRNLEATIVDVDPTSFEPLGLWLVKAEVMKLPRPSVLKFRGRLSGNHVTVAGIDLADV